MGELYLRHEFQIAALQLAFAILGIGMFAQLNVQPPQAKIYRSQMTEEERTQFSERFAAVVAAMPSAYGERWRTPAWDGERTGHE